ncbi:MAG: hypothetical protein ACTSQH_04730 [Candidatus Hodarchaeales archaeon]
MRGFSLKSKFLVFIFLFVISSYHPIIDGSISSYTVQSGDKWTYTVKSARRNFEYSFGAFESSINTRGYKLKNEIVELGEEIDLEITSVNSFPSFVEYELNSSNISTQIKVDKTLFLLSIQESLGRGILGNNFNFLDNTSGVTAGEYFFIAPVNNISWYQIYDVWNRSIPELEGTLEGTEAIQWIDFTETPSTFLMKIIYEGNMVDTASGIDLDFSYEAEFKWEKNGVLISYDIFSLMEGNYNDIYSAGFSLNIRLDRPFSEKTTGLDITLIPISITLIVFLRMRKKEKQ